MARDSNEIVQIEAHNKHIPTISVNGLEFAAVTKNTQNLLAYMLTSLQCMCCL